MMTDKEIIARIVALHPNADINITGADCSFEVTVICEEFAGKNTLQRQRPILALFSEELASGKLHALGIKAKTRTELAGELVTLK